MFNLKELSEFLAKSGMRKAGLATYFFSLLAFLLYEKALPSPEFVQLGTIITLAVFGGNAFEHHTKTREGTNGQPGKPETALGA